MDKNETPDVVGLSAGLGLVDRLRAESAGYGEWRVQSPIDGAYCFAPEARDYLDPEKEARDWLASYKKNYPTSQFAGYEVKCVRVQTTADKLMQVAAAEIERLQSMLEMAYCQKTGADSPHGLASCDNFKDWLTTLGPNAKVSGAGTASAGLTG